MIDIKIVPTKKANSQILAHSIKLKDLVLRKGKILNKEHLSMLIKNNIDKIYVAVIQKDDYTENKSGNLIAGEAIRIWTSFAPNHIAFLLS